MKKTVNLLIAILFCTTAFGQSNLSPKQISEKAKTNSEFDALEMVSTLKIIDAKGRERIRKTSSVTKKFGDVNKTLFKFLSPADVKGTGMLIFDYDNKNDDMWIYMPALRKTRRIVSSEKGKNFMGSEFTNADMTAPNIDDYTYKLLGEEKVNGVMCWKIENTPISEEAADENGFSKKVAYIGQANFLTYKVDIYNLDDELEKEMYISGYEMIDATNKKYMAKQMKVVNLLNGRVSIMIIENVQLGTNLPENTFTVANLEK